MAKESINKTVRLPLDIAEYINGDAGINQGIIRAVRQIKTLKAISTSELRGMFTPDEWKSLAESLNGRMVEDSLRYMRDVLIAHTDEAELYYKTATKHGVNVKTLNEKISKLSGIHIDAIYTRIESLYNKDYTKLDLENWANF